MVAHEPCKSIVRRYALVTERTERSTQLKVVYHFFGRFEERLLRDTPSGRCGREHAPSAVCGETGCTVIASADLEKIFSLVVIVDAGKKAEKRVFRLASAICPFLCNSRGKIKVIQVYR